MQERDKQAQTLYDYAADFQWIRMLGWSDDELRRVPVYEEATSADESLNLESVGGTSLNVSEAIDVTSGDARALHNLWVYKRTTPPELWQRLWDLVRRGGPSGIASASDTASAFPSSGPGSQR